MLSNQKASVSYGRHFRLAFALSLLSIPVHLVTLPSAIAQSATETPYSTDAASAPLSPTVPQQIRYSGKLPTRSGESVDLVFRIYAAAEGGRPLWTETQSVLVAEDGSYSVLLGSASTAGLPQSVFADGAARWLAITVDQNEESGRVPLSSVPYAMKSADADSLSGHRASDFVTQQQLAQTRNQLVQVQELVQAFAQAASQAPTVNPLSAPHPLTPGSVSGSGTTGTVPLWTGTGTIGNSEVVQGTLGIGINQPTPAAMLDVGGSENVNGILYLPPLATATSTAGQRSQLIQLSASAYSNYTKAPVTSTFKILTNFVGNNTSTPSGQLEFHYQPTATSYSTTVLSIAGTGVITFAPSQKFPGTISSVSATSPLTATTTAGATSVGLNETTLVSDISPAISSGLAGTYAQLGASNTFTQKQNFNGNTFFGAEEDVEVPSGTGIEALDLGSGIAIEGVSSQSSESIGVLGTLNATNGQSSSFNSLYLSDGFNPGVWADAPNNPNVVNSAALIATADKSYAGIFYNDSSTIPTITVLNNSTGGPTGNVAPISNVMRVGGPHGTCGFNQSGNISCTGQVKSIVPTKNGARQMETYTVQSAENWVEDYGVGQLTHGTATIALEAAFRETVNTGVEYHVFLTPGGDCKGLYVTNKTPGTFEVHELGGGVSTVPFDYKIVAKRNGLESQRLVDVTDRMKLEAENARFKPLPEPLQKPRTIVPRHLSQSAAIAPTTHR